MNPLLVGWKMYYANGSAVDSSQMNFNYAPSGGAEVFVKWYKVNGNYFAELESGLDYYKIDSNILNVKHGLNIRKERFLEIRDMAADDTDPVTIMVS